MGDRWEGKASKDKGTGVCISRISTSDDGGASIGREGSGSEQVGEMKV